MKVLVAVIAGFAAYYALVALTAFIHGFMTEMSPLGHYGDPQVLGVIYGTLPVLAAILAAVFVTTSPRTVSR